MKIIITEEQNDKLTRKVKMMIEKLGLQESIKILGGNTKLIKLTYENNPLEFMDNFKDLKGVINRDNPEYISYKKNDKVVMIQDDVDTALFFDYNEIWYFFNKIFNMENKEIQRILSQWLEDTLNLEGYRPSIIFEDRMILLEDNLNLKG
jgi:hypothetical protein